MSVKVNMDVQGILTSRGIGNSNTARLILANDISRFSDQCIPFDTGLLKNNHSIALDGSSITYHQSYAQAQYNRSGKSRSNNNSGLRGGQWTRRAVQAHKSEILNDVAQVVGGKPK